MGYRYEELPQGFKMIIDFEDAGSHYILKREIGYCLIPKALLLQTAGFKAAPTASHLSSQEKGQLNKKLSAISKKIKDIESDLINGFKVGSKKVVPYPTKTGETYIEKLNREWSLIVPTLLMINGIEKREKTKLPFDLKNCSRSLAVYLSIQFIEKSNAEYFAKQNTTPASSAEWLQLVYSKIGKKGVRNRPPQLVRNDLALILYNLNLKPEHLLFTLERGDRSNLSYKKFIELAGRSLPGKKNLEFKPNISG